MNQLRKMMLVILLTGVLVSFVLSYGATEKLFRPVEAIFAGIRKSSGAGNIGKKNDEIQFLLYRILQLFQKIWRWNMRFSIVYWHCEERGRRPCRSR